MEENKTPNNATAKKPEGRRVSPVETVTDNAVKNIRSMVDSNTVIGDPITTPDGTTIIPVSKVSIGFVSGGSDFATKANPKLCFGGGSGAGLTVTPVSFLIISPSGTVNTLPVNQSSVTAVDKIMDLAPGVIEEIRDLFRNED